MHKIIVEKPISNTNTHKNNIFFLPNMFFQST